LSDALSNVYSIIHLQESKQFQKVVF
jgi:hypothetical protein